MPIRVWLVVCLFGFGCDEASEDPPAEADAADPDAGATDGEVPDADTPDEGLPDGGVAADFMSLCDQTAEYCGKLYECATPERLLEDQSLFGHEDEAGCEAMVGEIVGGLCAEWAASIGRGRVDVALAAFVTCDDYMNALSCDDYINRDPSTHEPCVDSPFVTPLVEAGGDCLGDHECRDRALVCATGDEGEGTCAVAPGEGEPCAGDRCAEGLYCDEGRCRTLAEQGCVFEWDCPDGWWCDHPGNDFRSELETPDQQGVCVAEANAGQRCEDPDGCIAGLYCDDTQGADQDGFRLPGHCASPRPAGSPCNEPVDCESFDCAFETDTCR